MAKRSDPRRSADRAKMRADEVARQRDAELLRRDQFKPKGNRSMSDAVPNRSRGMTTPTSEWQDAQANKPKPPTPDQLF